MIAWPLLLAAAWYRRPLFPRRPRRCLRHHLDLRLRCRHHRHNRCRRSVPLRRRRRRRRRCRSRRHCRRFLLGRLSPRWRRHRRNRKTGHRRRCRCQCCCHRRRCCRGLCCSSRPLSRPFSFGVLFWLLAAVFFFFACRPCCSRVVVRATNILFMRVVKIDLIVLLEAPLKASSVSEGVWVYMLQVPHSRHEHAGLSTD